MRNLYCRSRHLLPLVVETPSCGDRRPGPLGAAARIAEAAAVLARQREPLGDVLLDPHRHPEVLAQQLGETFGVAAARAEQAGLKAPGVLGQRARRIDGARRAVGRAEPGGEAVVVGPVVVDRRLRLRPGTVEQREQAMVEDVEEARQRRIAARAQPLAHVLGEVERHRPLRPEQPEEEHAEARRADGPPARSSRAPRVRTSSSGNLAQPQRSPAPVAARRRCAAARDAAPRRGAGRRRSRARAAPRATASKSAASAASRSPGGRACDSRSGDGDRAASITVSGAARRAAASASLRHAAGSSASAG